MDDQIQQILMAKQQKLISELVMRNMTLESCVEVLKAQLASLANQELSDGKQQSDTDVDSTGN